MVTFCLPPDDSDSEDDIAEDTQPQARPALTPAKPASAAPSPFGAGSVWRNGTPSFGSRRSLFASRDGVPSGSFGRPSAASTRNIFRASAASESPGPSVFSPALPRSAMKKVFAPGATPEPTRTFRENIAHATPRGMTSKAMDKNLFSMRISSPPPELTGEVLTQKVPKDWNPKGSIYADQFLAHLCPPDLDEEQRRQFFCILDLRRLKYAANEIFARKDWKLNAINFAKEFEKSRSIILLRYGLYEFQTVKPSKEVLKRWRREHGLPDPDDEDDDKPAAQPTPSRSAASQQQNASKKRKADDDVFQSRSEPGSSVLDGKRRAMTDEGPPGRELPAPETPAPNKNKRKSSVDEDQPNKLQKSGPSSAKSLFERIANKQVGSAPSATNYSDGTRPNPPAPSQPDHGGLQSPDIRQVQPATTSDGSTAPARVFLDASSTEIDRSGVVGSGVGPDNQASFESGESAGERTTSSGDVGAAAATGPPSGSALFGVMPATTSVTAFGASAPSGSEPGEGAPPRSLFDRITKGTDGQPVRAGEKAEEKSAVEKAVAPVNQTWNPTTTPIKFAPTAAATPGESLFGTGASTFAPKGTSSASNLFGTATSATLAPSKSPFVGSDQILGRKDGGRLDRDSDSRSVAIATAPTSSSTMSEPTLATPSFSRQNLAATDNREDAVADARSGSTPNLFGSPSKQNLSAVTASGISEAPGFLKSTDKATTASAVSLFGKPATASESAGEKQVAKAGTLFATDQGAVLSGAGGAQVEGSLFGAKVATTTPAGGLGIAGPSTNLKPSPIFGAPSEAGAAASPSSPSKPKYSFESMSGTAPTNSPVIGSTINDTPEGPSGGMPESVLGGSPMRQDEQPPAKKGILAKSTAGPSASLFGLGNPQVGVGGFGTNTFGAPSSANNPPSFSGGSSTNVGSGSFEFSFNPGGTSGGSFHNPFASNPPSGPGSSAGGSFSFGGSSSGTAGEGLTTGTGAGGGASGSGIFQFGGASANPSISVSTPSVGGSIFGGSQAASGNATSIFGGVNSGAAGGGISFGASSRPPHFGTAGSLFGAATSGPTAIGHFQPLADGSSTAGTNSPLNFGGGSSLATTPAAGTPEPSNQAEGGGGEDGEGGAGEADKQDQINLTDGLEPDEELLHEVRAKVLKFMPPGEGADEEEKAKPRSPWSTQGVGQLRLLKHKKTSVVRLLLRADPRGNVAMNRAVLAHVRYEATEKYVKVTTSNEAGDGLETWMVQVKTKELAKQLAEALEKHKGSEEA